MTRPRFASSLRCLRMRRGSVVTVGAAVQRAMRIVIADFCGETLDFLRMRIYGGLDHDQIEAVLSAAALVAATNTVRGANPGEHR